MTTTKQDLSVTKYDIQSACDAIKDEILQSIEAMRLENQASLRQANAMRDQIWRKLLSLEDELKKLRIEMKYAGISPASPLARRAY